MTALVALLAVSLGLGMAARRTRVFPAQIAEGLNAFIVNVSLPALVLRSIHDVPLSAAMFGAAAMVWLEFAAAVLVFVLLGRAVRWARGTVGALVLTGGMANTALVGLPVIEAVLGREALGAGVFVDQIGQALVLATLGAGAAAAFSGRRVSPPALLKRILLFPAFVALVLGLALRPMEYPAWLVVVLDRIGSTLTPLGMFAIGYQLRLGALRGRVGPLAAGLGYKLAVAPALAGWVLAALADGSSLEWKVAVLQCGMPPMILGGVLASQHELDPPLAATMVGVGIPVSALTLAAIAGLIR